MQTRQTLLMFAGLLLVLLNALVAGHWLNIKGALVDAPGSPAPTVSGNPIDNLVSGAAKATGNALKNRITSQAKKQIGDPLAGLGNRIGSNAKSEIVDPVKRFVDPTKPPWWWDAMP